MPAIALHNAKLYLVSAKSLGAAAPARLRSHPFGPGPTVGGMPYAVEPRGARYWVVSLETDGRRSETGVSYATPEEAELHILTLEKQDVATRRAEQKLPRRGRDC